MTVDVRLFARLRELCGNQPEVRLELEEGATAADAFAALCARCEGARPFRETLAVAINDHFGAWDDVLHSGDAVSFIPPVSGGSEVVGDVEPRRFAVVETPISAASLRDEVAGPGHGAVCTFEGTVRDHTGEARTSHLEYEAHAELAEKVFADIAAAAARRWGISAMAIHHRVGRLEIGEVSVAIAVAAEHRAAAFDACRFAIDQLKVSAPVWKKEFGPDGSYWVEGPTATPVAEGEPDGDPRADEQSEAR